VGAVLNAVAIGVLLALAVFCFVGDGHVLSRVCLRRNDGVCYSCAWLGLASVAACGFLRHVLACRGCQTGMQGYKVCFSFALRNIRRVVCALCMGTVLELLRVKAHSLSMLLPAQPTLCCVSDIYVWGRSMLCETDMAR
jgi:hypothetical protein